MLTLPEHHLGGFRVPALTLSRHQVGEVHFTGNSSASTSARIAYLRSFAGSGGFESVAAAIPEWGRVPRRRWFRQVTICQWLVDRSNYTADEAAELLDSFGYKPHVQLARYAGNPRTLVAVLAAFSQPASVVVFSTELCDPLGRKQVLSAVFDRIADKAALHIANSFYGGKSDFNFSPQVIASTESHSSQREAG